MAGGLNLIPFIVISSLVTKWMVCNLKMTTTAGQKLARVENKLRLDNTLTASPTDEQQILFKFLFW